MLEILCCKGTRKTADIFKKANVIPIFKKGEISNPGNYRPISLTSAVCKVIESIIRESIIEHMTCNNLISNAQHGFLPKRLCVYQLLTSIEYWTLMKCRKVTQLTYYVDFKKVPHERLLIELKA